MSRARAKARGSRRRLCAAALLGLASCRGSPPAPHYLGTVERTEVELSAPVSEVLVELPVRRGERVEAGRVIARLDDSIARAQRDAAAAQLEAARAARRQTRPELERVRGLHRSGAVSDQALDRASRAHEEAIARDLEARARLAEAERRLSEHVIVTPVAGVVDQLPFDPGERVPAGGIAAVLLSEDPPWVRVWLPGRVVARLEIGEEAEVDVDGIHGRLRGRVTEIARESEFTPHYALTEREREHLVYEARVELLDAPPGLRPGIAAEVEIPEDGAGGRP
jgi:HlyD family secretion protein